MPHTKTVTVTELRKNLARLVASVRYGSDFVVISRKDEDNVYLISQADWDLLDRKIDEFDIGRWSKRRGRMVGGLMSLLWRERTLESEDDAPSTDAGIDRVEVDAIGLKTEWDSGAGKNDLVVEGGQSRVSALIDRAMARFEP